LCSEKYLKNGPDEGNQMQTKILGRTNLFALLFIAGCCSFGGSLASVTTSKATITLEWADDRSLDQPLEASSVDQIIAQEIEYWYQDYASALPPAKKVVLADALKLMIARATVNAAKRHVISVSTGFMAAAQRAVAKSQDATRFVELATPLIQKAQKLQTAELEIQDALNKLMLSIETNVEFLPVADALEEVRLAVKDILGELVKPNVSTISGAFASTLNATESISKRACTRVDETIAKTIEYNLNEIETIMEVAADAYLQYAVAVEELIYQSKVFRDSISKAQLIARDLIQGYLQRVEQDLDSVRVSE
jgi:hypothetical protein